MVKKVACSCSPHLSVLPYYTAVLLITWQMHAIFRDFSNGVVHVMKVTVTAAQKTCSFGLYILAGDNLLDDSNTTVNSTNHQMPVMPLLTVQPIRGH